MELEGTLFHLFKTMCDFIEADRENKNVSIMDIIAMKDEIKNCMEDILDVLLLGAGEETATRGLVKD